MVEGLRMRLTWISLPGTLKKTLPSLSIIIHEWVRIERLGLQIKMITVTQMD
jgi:hypothetical protein